MDATVRISGLLNLLLCLGDDVKLNLRSHPSFPESIKAAVVPPIDETSGTYTFQYDNTEGLNLEPCDVLSVEKWSCCTQVEALEQRYLNLLTHLGLTENEDGTFTAQ